MTYDFEFWDEWHKKWQYNDTVCQQQLTSCKRCGSVVMDETVHDKWHENMGPMNQESVGGFR